ncbi:MAG: cytochrome c-type biogenesis CcmF C-terminal domain-containing protein, partial [Acidimicrobiales bacterium]
MTAVGDVAIMTLVAAGLASAVVSGVAARRGDRRVRRIGLWLLAAAVGAGGVAVIGLGWAMIRSDFTLAYVTEQSRSTGSAWYRLAGLWGGMAGSLLVWTAMLGAVGLVTVWRLARQPVALVATVQATAAAVVAGFGLVLVALADPFVDLSAPAVDGRGLTPILEHPAMLYHPPLLYLGLTSLLAPFALTMGAAATDSLDARWLARCRRWALVPWVLLGVGMVAGAHWAYAEVGWGGFWAWDPVENTALLPWLAVTAFIHAVMLRARFVAAALVVSAFLVALLGTLLTRSGATQSVHAFAEDPAIGRALLVLVVSAGVAASVLLAGACRRSPAVLGSKVDRSGRARALRAQVTTVVIALVVVLVGTVYPLVQTLVGRDDVGAVDGGFFALFVGPLALVVLVLAGVGPRLGGRRPGSLGLAGPVVVGGVALAAAVVAGWRTPFALAVAAFGGFTLAASVIDLVRNRRGGHLVHLGLAVFLVGVAGSSTGGSVTATVGAGERVSVAGYQVGNDGARVTTGPDEAIQRVAAPVTVERRGEVVARLTPEIRVDRATGDQLAETAVWSSLLTDVQVALRDAGDDGQALLQVHVRPLVAWVWWGGLLMVAGGAGALAQSRMWGGYRAYDRDNH